jgi:hypothetical protein
MLFTTVLSILLAAGAGAQKDIAVPKQEELVTVAGCVTGSHFKPSRETRNDLPADLYRAREWTLQGKRELLNRLRKEHDGHYEEITGVIKVPPQPQQADTTVRTKDVGKKTRVTIGTRQSSSNVEAPPPATIVVESFRHIGARCAPR